MSEYGGDMPNATPNYFRVYSMCMEVWKDITEQYCVSGVSGTPKEFGTGSLDVAHPIHKKQASSEIKYIAISAEHVDLLLRARGGVKWCRRLSALRWMGGAVVKVWGWKRLTDLVREAV